MNEIDKKIEEIIELAEKDKNYATLQVILYAYQGAKLSNLDALLAKNVQDYVKETLLPVTNFSRKQQNKK